jgi:short-subunit dehydrogenase
MTRCFIEQMKEHGEGHIVSISSTTGLNPSPYAHVYSATKAALNAYMIGLNEKLRLDKLGDKINLTCVCPYYVSAQKEPEDSRFVFEIFQIILSHSLSSNSIRFPPLDVDDTSTDIVDAIVKNDSFVTIPSYYAPCFKFVNLFPLTVQQLVRDRVFKEYNVKSKKV